MCFRSYSQPTCFCEPVVPPALVVESWIAALASFFDQASYSQLFD